MLREGRLPIIVRKVRNSSSRRSKMGENKVKRKGINNTKGGRRGRGTTPKHRSTARNEFSVGWSVRLEG